MTRSRLQRHLWHLAPLSIVGVLLAPLYACSSDDSAPQAAAPTGPQLAGQVTSASGGPVAGVLVTAGGQSATTDAQGAYRLRAGAGEAVVRFKKPGFVDGLERMKIGATHATQLDVVLLPEAQAIPLDASAGGEITSARGSKLVVPPNALVDASGAPVTGQVDVFLTPIDPSRAEEVRAAPGDFVASQAGQPTMLESFGMVDITIRRGQDKLQVKNGAELELRIPVPESVAQPAPTMPLWSFDEAKGIWIDEGTATYDAASKTYVAKAKHMSFWNCDQPYLATCVCGTVFDKAGGKLSGARIMSTGVSYFGSSEATTDDEGRFCIAIRKDSDVQVTAYHKSGGGQSRALRSGSADTAVPPERDARCVDVGRWDVERDVYVAANGSRTDCNNLPNAFAGTCVEAMYREVGACFQPAGSCTIKTSGPGGFNIEYGNGAKIVSDGAGGYKNVSPDGRTCVTTQIEQGTVGPGMTPKFKYVLPSGAVYDFTMSPDGAYSIRCPNGETVNVTKEQQDVVQACSSPGTGAGDGGATSPTGEACTYDGFDGGGISPVGSCADDSQCASAGPGSVCCDLQSTKMCLSREVCDQVRAGQD